MDSVAKYVAVNTKIQIMQLELLKAEDYEAILRKQTVAEVAQYLKEHTAYGHILADVDTASIDRGTLESLINQNLARNLDKIMHYYSGHYRKFITTFYAKYEIEELKELARVISNENTIAKALTDKKEGSDIIARPVSASDLSSGKKRSFIGKFSGCDPDRIFAAKQIKDMIYALQGSEFYRYLLPLVDENAKENLFRFEMVLDMAYYSILKNEWSRLSRYDRAMLKRAQGMIADLLNLQWIYRGFKFYKLSPEELLNYTINIDYKLDQKFMKKLCYAGSIEEFYELAAKTDYKFLFKNDTSTDVFMERRIDRHIYYKLKEMLEDRRLSIIDTFAYIFFLEFEAKDIISMIELVGYKVPLEQAKKYLIKTV